MSRLNKVKTGVGCEGFHPNVPLGFDKRNKMRNRRVLGEGGADLQMAATSLYDDVFLDTEECHEREANCVDADVDSLVGSLKSTRGGEVGADVSY